MRSSEGELALTQRGAEHTRDSLSNPWRTLQGSTRHDLEREQTAKQQEVQALQDHRSTLKDLQSTKSLLVETETKARNSLEVNKQRQSALEAEIEHLRPEVDTWKQQHLALADDTTRVDDLLLEVERDRGQLAKDLDAAHKLEEQSSKALGGQVSGYQKEFKDADKKTAELEVRVQKKDDALHRLRQELEANDKTATATNTCKELLETMASNNLHNMTLRSEARKEEAAELQTALDTGGSPEK